MDFRLLAVFALAIVALTDGAPQPRHHQRTKEHQRTKKSLRASFMTGGFTPIDANGKEAEDIALEAVRAMEAAGKINPDNYLGLSDVEEASKQVVNGWNYQLNLNVFDTCCPTSGPRYCEEHTCDYIRVYNCHLDYHTKPFGGQGEAGLGNVSCHFMSFPGGFTPIDANGKEAEDIAFEAVRAMEAAGMINPDNYLGLSDVEEASKQVVNGWNYQLYLYVFDTCCPKSGPRYCDTNCDIPVQNCLLEYHTKPFGGQGEAGLGDVSCQSSNEGPLEYSKI